MAAPQIDFPKGPNRFITITYQSNDYLNDELDGQVKPEIARLLIAKIATIISIHNYVHGQIIIEVPVANAVTALKTAIKELERPMAARTPALLYSVDLASFLTGPPVENLIYVSGSDGMNANFLQSIEDVWPR